MNHPCCSQRGSSKMVVTLHFRWWLSSSSREGQNLLIWLQSPQDQDPTDSSVWNPYPLFGLFGSPPPWPFRFLNGVSHARFGFLFFLKQECSFLISHITFQISYFITLWLGQTTSTPWIAPFKIHHSYKCALILMTVCLMWGLSHFSVHPRKKGNLCFYSSV
jgi:hypothetical protein